MGTGTGSIVDTVIAIIYPTKPTNECSEDKKKKMKNLLWDTCTKMMRLVLTLSSNMVYE